MYLNLFRSFIIVKFIITTVHLAHKVNILSVLIFLKLLSFPLRPLFSYWIISPFYLDTRSILYLSITT